MVLRQRGKIVVAGFEHRVVRLPLHYPLAQRIAVERWSKLILPISFTKRRLHRQVLDLIARNIQKGHVVGMELTPEQLAHLREHPSKDYEYVFLSRLLGKGAEVLPLEAQELHDFMHRPPADADAWHALSLTRASVHARNAVTQNAQMMILGERHAVQVSEIFRRAGINFESHVSGRQNSYAEYLRTAEQHDLALNGMLDGFAAGVKRAASSKSE